MSHRVAVSVGHYPGEPKKEIEYPANELTATLLHSQLVNNGYQADLFKGELPEKVKNINEYDPAIAIECHYNALEYPYNPNKYGSGYEICTWQESIYGKLLATKILEGFYRRLPFERRGIGIWERTDLYFLKHTKMPAVVVEPLFLDNHIEATFLQMKRGYEFIAASYFYGITEYFKEINQ